LSIIVIIFQYRHFSILCNDPMILGGVIFEWLRGGTFRWLVTVSRLVRKALSFSKGDKWHNLAIG
jgi:hypothetical protein